MQTIKRETVQRNIDQKTLDLLQKPFQEIDLPFLRDAVYYLRSTVNKEMVEVVRPLGSTAIDLAGTGGSGVTKFNTSTAISFILAAYGVDVIKFGNRSITGTSGSLDFLSAIGCLKDLQTSDFERVLKSTNLLFLNAPVFYPKLSEIREMRKKLKKPTVFNFIGPLLNPAQPAYRLFGISNSYMHLLINQFIKSDGSTKRAITVHSTIRSESSVIEVDEILPNTSNLATLIEQSIGGDDPANLSILDIPSAVSREKSSFLLENVVSLNTDNKDHCTNSDSGCIDSPIPTSYGIPPAEVNAKTFLNIIDRNDSSSIHFHGITLNAAAGFLAAGAVSTFDEGIKLTEKLIASGSVSRKLAQVRGTLS